MGGIYNLARQSTSQNKGFGLVMHIVQFKNQKYAVRRWFIIGFQYLDAEGHWWNGQEYVVKYCLLDTAQDARERAQKYDFKIIWKGTIR
jgi:hypothetical protein